MKKIILLYLLTPLMLFSEPDDELEGSVETEDISMDGQACYDYLDSKRYQEGNNERKGKKFLIAVGIDSSGANMSQLAYIDSIQNAFIRAQNLLSNLDRSSLLMVPSSRTEISASLIKSMAKGNTC